MFTDSSTLPDQGCGSGPKRPGSGPKFGTDLGAWTLELTLGRWFRNPANQPFGMVNKNPYKLIPGLPPPLKEMVDPISMIKTLM